MEDTVNDQQHERHNKRFERLDNEVAGVKTDIAGVKADVTVVKSELHGLKTAQEAGFVRLENALNNRQASISPAFLFGFIGILAIGVGAFYTVVELKTAPTYERVQDLEQADKSQWEYQRHLNAGERLSLTEEKSERNRQSILEERAERAEAILAAFARVDHESDMRDKSQQLQIDRLISRQDILFEDRVKMAYHQGQADTLKEWLRDDDEAQKDDLSQHTAQANHPFGVLSEVSKLEGLISQLTTRVDAIDKQVSKFHNEPTTSASEHDKH